MQNEDKSTWAIGGGVIIGLGVGFFFLPESVFGFVGSLLVGLGMGLVVTAVLSVIRKP
ncbi:hypothetical protein ACUYOF_15640 [Photobacterium ganghwense]|uniref:hypothetical protein n=1 Tax=Photobacterium ganghwense TaxID=320778 RepID=UPI00405700EE